MVSLRPNTEDRTYNADFKTVKIQHRLKILKHHKALLHHKYR